MVTNYDSWHPNLGAVKIIDIITVLTSKTGKARDMLQRLPAGLARPNSVCTEHCNYAPDNAVLTPPEHGNGRLLPDSTRWQDGCSRKPDEMVTISQ